MPTRSRSYRLGESVVRTFTPAAFRLDPAGAEHLPADGGCLVVTNHLSRADPFVVGRFLLDQGRLPRFMAKDSLFELPVVGSVLTNAGQIPVARESATASAALGPARDALLAGECVVIYPEGTLTRDPALWPMRGKLGAARLALATGCPVIPVASWGSQWLMPAQARLPRLGRRPLISLRVGPPVDLGPYLPQEGAAPDVRGLIEATRAIMADVTGLLAVIRDEAPPRQVWNPSAHGQPVIGDDRTRRRTSRRGGRRGRRR